jgi:localization factor PodJL
MNSRVSWSNEGIDPSVRERAEAAARRAGMSLNEWLNSTLGDFNPTNFRSPYDQGPAMPAQESHHVADVHERLDAIARQIERISQAIPRNDAPRGELLRDEPPVARRLNDAIARLDARLAQISSSSQGRQPPRIEPEMAERAANQFYRPSPPLSPASLDFAIPKTTARQSEPDDLTPQQEAPPRSAPMAPASPQTTSSVLAAAPSAVAGPDFSSLERHLLKITSQIEALQRPDHIEQSIAAFRGELSEIHLAITEAMPRRAIESIEGEVRALALRIDDSRQCGIDSQALTGIERTLGEIREVLRSLTPAEQLAGYDEAIRNLTAKLDEILRANDDPSTIRQLEGAIAALRGIVANIASNDALARLSEDVHVLSSKVDQLARADRSDSLAIIEQRIAALASSFESREHRPVIHDNSEQIENALRALSDRIDRMPVPNDNSESVENALRALTDRFDRMPVGSVSMENIENALRALAERLDSIPAGSVNTENIENALRALADRFDRMPVGSDNASALAHLEQRVTYLLERLESTADHGAGNFERVEEGLQDVLHQLERQHASIAAFTANSRNEPASDDGFADLVKRELSDIRFGQAETDRHTQGSLEAVHNTLGHVVDRLTMIEGDLRSAHVQTASLKTREAPGPEFSAPAALAHEVLQSPSFEAPLAPTQAERPTAEMTAQGEPDLPDPAQAQNHFDAAPREFHSVSAATPPAAAVIPQAISEILEPHTAPSVTNEPALPPDHPLEPGTRPSGRAASPSERIAASESAIREIPATPREPVSTSSFIAAARRAAQAAAAAPPPEKAGRGTAKKSGGKAGETSTITSKIRSLLVGASVVVIVLGTFKMAMTLLDTGGTLQMPAMENSAEPQPSAKSSAEDGTSPAMPGQMAPPMTSPAPIGKQSFNNYIPDDADGTASIAIPQNVVAPSPSSTSDVTGAIPLIQGTAGRSKLALIPIPPSEHLPDAIGGPALRSAALKGDPTAAYEVAVRFAEGKGVAANYDEAVKWLDRAAQAGVVPAIFRLGTFYEKGLAVTKDVAIARHYYVQAADRGNAKAMHNLAVLDADGGGKGADYRSAVQWFRKAADRGVADSQYNLGILYARGIGVEQNLAESFKWFSLAAAQGDADAGRKRDDVANRLDPQSLAAAKLAIQTFTPEPQPDDAVNVAVPAGGWDFAPAQATPAKPVTKPPSKRTAAAH